MDRYQKGCFKGEPGQALILVLIILVVGALVIVPILNYVCTGLMGIRVSKDSLFTQYALDAAAEYQLWQLVYGNPEDLLGQTETITVNGVDVEVGLEVPTPPESVEAPLVVGGGKGLEIGLESSPNWIKYEGTITYTIKFYNVGTASIVASLATATLPIGFQYLGNLTTDFQDSNIIVTSIPETYAPEEYQRLEFEITGDATTRKVPKGTAGGEAPYRWIKFDAMASVDAGIFYTGAAGLTDAGTDEIEEGAPVWSSVYYTKPRAGQASCSLAVKVNLDGSVEVISYQVE